MRNLLLVMLVACGRPIHDSATAALTPPGPEVDVALSAVPFAQITGEGVRVRFETWGDDRPIPVHLDRGDGEPVEVEVTRTTEERSFSWPPEPGDVPHLDRAGPHTLHEATFTQLEPGRRYRYTVHAGPTQVIEGSVRASPAAGEPFTAVFVGDTMYPTDEAVHVAMGVHAPDLYLHGGDLQYQTMVYDTWNGSMRAAAPVLTQALFHIAPGNHEYEGPLEFGEVFQRWFEGAGHDAHLGYHAVDYGGVRFLMLDSEDGLGDADSAQVQWLTAQLADASGRVRTAVPVFHRPAYTLSRHAPRADIRAVLAPLFRAHDVRLVLTSHNHSYERFDVDGVTWIVEGGGGALPYNVNAQVEDRPDEVALRQAAVGRFGYLILAFDEEGVSLTRRDLEGQIQDTHRVALP